jgi:hypothetical protein
MKIIFILFGICLVMILGCKKNKANDSAILPWQFQLQDSSLNKTYNYKTATFGIVNTNEYPTFKSTGYTDSTRFEIGSRFNNYLNLTTALELSINLFSTDTILSRRLIISNSLPTKQNTLQEIFAPGKTYTLLDGSPSERPQLFCIYRAENKITYANNASNAVSKGTMTVTKATIINEGSKAKINVSLNYDFILQATNGSGSWLTEIKKITGIMYTFFELQ